MTVSVSSLLIAALCRQAPQVPAAPPAPAAPPGAIARVDGEPVPLEGFRDWLVRTHGWRHVDDYLDLMLLQKEAKRAGVPIPTPAELEAAFEADWRDQILWRHRGDEKEFEQELTSSGLDRQGWRDHRFGTLEQEALAKRILRARPPTDDEKKKLWLREFPDGARVHVHVAFFDKLAELAPGTSADPKLASASDDRARVRAEAFHKKVSADRAQFAKCVATDADLCPVLRHDSMPLDLRSQGGDLPRLHADHFGGALREPLAHAQPGDLLGPLTTPQGYYVVELVERGAAPYDAVQDELSEIWRTREPSQGEIFWLKQELRKQSRIERFPLNPPKTQ